MLQIASHTFTVRVTDNGTPSLYAERSVTINVGRRSTTLVYTGDGSEQYSDQQALSATLTDSGGGGMNGSPIAGKTIGFVIGTESASSATNASGISMADLILTQNPNLVYTVASSFAGDAYYLVVPHNGIREGGYGFSSRGERTAGPRSCLPQESKACD